MTSNILDRGKSENQARDEIYRADARRWYPGTHAHNAFSIMSPRDGHEVARCDRRQDRDHLLVVARNFDVLVDALEGVIKVSDRQTVEYDAARAALKLAGR